MVAKDINVMLLENDASHVEAIRCALQSSNGHFKVQVACSLREYRDSVTAGPPDIALLNMVMPDGRSLELVSSPSEANPFPMLIMASRGDEKTAVAAMKAGALDYVVKSPQAFAVMPRILSRALSRWQLLQERKLAEEKLRQSEAKYSTILEQMDEAYYEVDSKGNYTFFNDALCRQLGYSREELRGLNYKVYIPPEERRRVIEAYSAVFNTGLPIIRLPVVNIKKDATRIFVEASIFPIRNEKGEITGLRGISLDITVRKRLEEEQQRVEKLESVGLLAGGIAHDFNNILTAILGNISLASMEAAPGSEICESLEKAEKASLRAKDLTGQLLTFSKGGAPIKTLASVPELLKDTAGFALRGSNVKCQFSIPDDLWHAEIDEGQVSQVMHNLVINAQQSMIAGGDIDVYAENMVLTQGRSLGMSLPLKKGNYIRIAVTDHGSGIPVEHMARIFDPFFTTKQQGSGLGLATSFSIARNHGGHLSVESEVGSGSTFYLYLPASTQTSAPKQDKKEQVKPVGKARILVMDDEEGVRDVAGRMLKHIGYEDIEFAADGAAAIKLYKAAMASGNPFSAVILDLTIPGGMGGKETVKQLLKIDPGVKAIVSSGYADESAMAEYRGYGFSGMAAKPYTFDKLRQALFELTGRRRRTDK